MNYELDLFNQPQTADNFWTNSVHKSECSINGQQYINQNRKRLGGQNKEVFEALMNGMELDASIVRKWQPEIWHLHSRIADLASPKNGFLISTKLHHEKKLTVYFMTLEQIKYNSQLIEGK